MVVRRRTAAGVQQFVCKHKKLWRPNFIIHIAFRGRIPGKIFSRREGLQPSFGWADKCHPCRSASKTKKAKTRMRKSQIKTMCSLAEKMWFTVILCDKDKQSLKRFIMKYSNGCTTEFGASEEKFSTIECCTMTTRQVTSHPLSPPTTVQNRSGSSRHLFVPKD